jgi:hypothetical protein
MIKMYETKFVCFPAAVIVGQRRWKIVKSIIIMIVNGMHTTDEPATGYDWCAHERLMEKEPCVTGGSEVSVKHLLLRKRK